MHMIRLHINLDYLDIAIEIREMSEKLLGIFLYPFDKDISAISRSPDDVVFGFIHGMRALSKPHTAIIPYVTTSSGLPIHHQTESGDLSAY